MGRRLHADPVDAARGSDRKGEINPEALAADPAEVRVPAVRESLFIDNPEIYWPVWAL
jgi:hypothetical protein